jgi:RND family efflux transporter MFP subunit
MPTRPVQLVPLALVLVACKAAPATEAQDVFPIALPSRADAEYEREYVGEVQAVQRTEIRSRVKGRIESVGVDEGKAVKAGQVLFSIGSKQLQQELRRARAAAASAAAELKAAEVERTNTRMLLEKSVVSPAEMALLESKVQSLAARVEEARAQETYASINLSYAEVRAPFDGVVNRIPKKVGSLVEEGELLTTLTNPSEVFVYFRVSEQEYLEHAAAKEEGRPRTVSFKLANGELLSGVGTMDAVESEIDRNTGTIAFRARFQNQRQMLKHGSSGKIVVKSTFPDAVVIPQKSTFEVQDHVYVYVVDAEGRARARRIQPKVRLKDTFVVQSGLAAGERFIAEGIQKVKDGERIAIRTGSAPSVSAL